MTAPAHTRTVYALVALPLLACASKPEIVRPYPDAPAEAVPQALAVEGGSTTLGFSSGVLRRKASVESFEISETLTTVEEYRRCVEAGVCSAPALHIAACVTDTGIVRNTYAGGDAWAETPVTCVTAAQAGQFCSWVGGRLPSAEEWLLAARGPEVVRFAWGAEPPTCDHHFLAEASQSGCCREDCRAASAFRVRRHREAVSPSGLLDVMLTPGELTAGPTTEAPHPCRNAETGCVYYGMTPAAIDGVRRLPGGGEAKGGPPVSFDANPGFRCVWEVEK